MWSFWGNLVWNKLFPPSPYIDFNKNAVLHNSFQGSFSHLFLPPLHNVFNHSYIVLTQKEICSLYMHLSPVLLKLWLRVLFGWMKCLNFYASTHGLHATNKLSMSEMFTTWSMCMRTLWYYLSMFLLSLISQLHW
jgi:hypothetical protein